MGETGAMDVSPTLRRRLASLAAVVCGVAAVLTVSSWWLASSLLDPDRFAEATADALEEPEVRQAVAVVVTDETVELVVSFVDPRDLLPGPVRGLGGLAEDLMRDAVAEGVTQVIERDGVQDWLASASREAHIETISLIRDGRSRSGSFVQDAEEQAVRLDLTGVIAVGFDALVDRRWAPGVLGDAQPALRGGIDSFRVWVADLTGYEIDPDIGTVVVYRQSTVDEGGLALRSARWGAEIGADRFGLIAVVVVVSGIATFVLTPDRRRTLSFLGFVVAVTSVVVYFYWRAVASDVEALVADPGVRLAVEIIVDHFARPMSILMASLFGVGVVLAAAGVWWPVRRRSDPSAPRADTAHPPAV